MTKINENTIKNILKNVKDINSQDNIIDSGILKNIIIDNNLISIILHIKVNKSLLRILLINVKN
jgi:hypothetical protein